MQLNLDTRLSLAFLAGMVGLMEQAIAALLGVGASQILVGAFVSLMIGPIIGGAVKGSDGSNNKGSTSNKSNGSPNV